ncbi:TonB-dependent receptor domain-containing protein [Desulfuromonas versatilis]|nr:TonB-dependent receptor [Desulfuromonas versatilis]
MLHCLSVAALAFAEEVPLLEEIVVRGEHESPAMESLSIREVRESPARDIGEALQRVEGLDFVRKGAIANDVVLRGFQGDDLNVLLDGVRLYGGCPNRMDSPAFHFDFAEVEQIHILKGPYDLSNPGSLGGLVEATTRSAAPGFGGDLNLTLGSWDMVNAAGTIGFGGEGGDALAGHAYKYSLPPRSGDGKRITDIYPVTSSNRYRPEQIDSRAYDIHTTWLKAGLNPTAGSRSELGYSYQEADHVLYPYLQMDAEYDRTHRLNWLYRIADPVPGLEQIQLQAFWNQVNHLMHDELRESSRPSMMVTRDYMMRTDAYSRVVGLKLGTTLAAGDGTLKTGLDAYRRTWDAANQLAAFGYEKQPMIPDVDTDNLGAWGEYSLPLGDSLTLTGGVRGDLTRVEANKLESDRLGSLYQPYFPGTTLEADADFAEWSGNLQLSWSAGDALEVFAGLGSGVRVPDPQELYVGLRKPMGSNRVGNPELDPTRNNQVDLGVKYTAERIYLSASLFYSRLQDYIELVRLPDPDGADPLLPATSFENIEASLWGGEIGAQLALPGDLFLRAALAYSEGENRDDDTPLAEIPPLNGSLTLRYDSGRWFVEASEQFADHQDRVDPALDEQPTAGWAITNLKAGLTRSAWDLYLGVDNLFDKFYTRHLSYQRTPFASGVQVPEPGRFAYLSVAWHY